MCSPYHRRPALWDRGTTWWIGDRDTAKGRRLRFGEYSKPRKGMHHYLPIKTNSIVCVGMSTHRSSMRSVPVGTLHESLLPRLSPSSPSLIQSTSVPRPPSPSNRLLNLPRRPANCSAAASSLLQVKGCHIGWFVVSRVKRIIERGEVV